MPSTIARRRSSGGTGSSTSAGGGPRSARSPEQHHREQRREVGARPGRFGGSPRSSSSRIHSPNWSSRARRVAPRPHLGLDDDRELDGSRRGRRTTAGDPEEAVDERATLVVGQRVAGPRRGCRCRSATAARRARRTRGRRPRSTSGPSTPSTSRSTSSDWVTTRSGTTFPSRRAGPVVGAPRPDLAAAVELAGPHQRAVGAEPRPGTVHGAVEQEPRVLEPAARRRGRSPRPVPGMSAHGRVSQAEAARPYPRSMNHSPPSTTRDARRDDAAPADRPARPRPAHRRRRGRDGRRARRSRAVRVHRRRAADASTTLTRRYARLVAGPADPSREVWHNWIVRLADDGTVVGTVQATIHPGAADAEVAWVIGVPWQGRGYASEAAAALVDWLAQTGIDDRCSPSSIRATRPRPLSRAASASSRRTSSSTASASGGATSGTAS